ncbi:4Fe-4S binding protein [Desulfopila sp. IMCC35008]
MENSRCDVCGDCTTVCPAEAIVVAVREGKLS